MSVVQCRCGAVEGMRAVAVVVAAAGRTLGEEVVLSWREENRDNYHKKKNGPFLPLACQWGGMDWPQWRLRSRVSAAEQAAKVPAGYAHRGAAVEHEDEGRSPNRVQDQGQKKG